MAFQVRAVQQRICYIVPSNRKTITIKISEDQDQPKSYTSFIIKDEQYAMISIFIINNQS